MERCKQIVEPAGATPLAAVLSGKLDVKGKRVVCVMSGGNIDVSFVQSIIEQGLVARPVSYTHLAKNMSAVPKSPISASAMTQAAEKAMYEYRFRRRYSRSSVDAPT